MTELIIGGIRTRFEKKKQFKDFDQSFTEGEIQELEETVESCLNTKDNGEDHNEVKSFSNLSEEEINRLQEECIALKNNLEEKQEFNSKILNKIIAILDQVDEIHRYALEVEDVTLRQYLVGIKEQIDKEINEIELQEISCIGKIVDEKMHKCVQIVESEGKLENEIVHVTQKGYLLKGDVIREASVMAAK